MMKKWMFTSMLGLTMIGLLVACSDKGKQTETPEGSASVGVAATPGPAELVFYMSNGTSEARFNQFVGDALRKKFPQFTIKFILGGTNGVSLDQLILSNTRFDIFSQGPGFYESQAFPVGIEYDMTALIKKYNFDLNRIDPSMINYIKQSSGEKHYFLPTVLENMVLYYNKGLFDRFGVPYPVDGMTWDEMIDRSKRLTRMEDGIQYYGFSTNTSTIQGMNPLSIPLADLATDTPTINKDVRWRTFFDFFYQQPKQAPGYLNAIKELKGLPTVQMFGQKPKNIAMFVYQGSIIKSWAADLKTMNWDIVALPSFPGQKGIGGMATPQLFGITKMAENKDAAMAAIQYLLSDEHQMYLARTGDIPVLTSDAVRKELGKETEFPNLNWQAFFYNKFAPLAPRPAYYSELNTIYQKYFVQAALENMDLNTALRTAEEEAIQAINKFKN